MTTQDKQVSGKEAFVIRVNNSESLIFILKEIVKILQEKIIQNTDPEISKAIDKLHEAAFWIKESEIKHHKEE